MRTRLLLVDEDAAQRLAAVQALRDDWDVVSVPHGDDPLRAYRQSRAQLVLVAVHRVRPDATVRLARLLRTDLRPAERLAFYEAGAPRLDPEEVRAIADGYLAPATPSALPAFAAALLGGEHPFPTSGPAPVGPLRRWLRRRLRQK